MESSVDEVAGSALVGDLAPAGPAGQPGDAVAAHHQFHGATSHNDVAPVNKLSVHTLGPIGLPERVMDLSDDFQ